MVTRDNPYIPVMLSLVPRILTNLDRDADSPTYGSFDRSHWHLKATGFSSAVLQQAALALAVAYANDFPGNPYYLESRVKEWIAASLSFWARSQNRDGSYDEYWRHEGSFPATAFSAFSATEVYLLLGLKDERLAAAMERSGRFLCNRSERFAANQEVVSSAAIYNLYLITGRRTYLEAFEKKIAGIRAMQSKEGFLPEHGAADVGYSSVSLDYLSLLHEKTGRQDIAEMCNALIGFLSYFIHPDASAGGRYASRNTEYILPAGLASCSRFNALAGSMLEALKHCIPLSLGIDERYWLHYAGYSYARALIAYRRDQAQAALPCRQRLERLMQDAGFYVRGEVSWYIIVSLLKGGSFRLYLGDKLFWEDTGYRIIKGKSVFHSEIGGHSRYSAEAGRIEIEKNFYRRGFVRMSPLCSFLLYLYGRLFGNAFWRYFRRRFIQAGRRSGIVLSRTLTIGEGRIIVEDRIRCAPRASLVHNPQESIKDIPSAKFFCVSSLTDQARPAHYPVDGDFGLRTEIDLVEKKVRVSETAGSPIN